MKASEARKYFDNENAIVINRRVYEKCKEALDLLEKKERGLLIELPVPIGSRVYRIYYGEVESFYFAKEDIVDILMWWNIKIFASKEEAEKRSLEELKNGM